MSDFFSGGAGLGVAGAILGSAIGYVAAISRNSTQIANLQDRIRSLEVKVDRLAESENASDKEAATALASINTTLTSMAEILNKLDQRMTGLEGRMSHQEMQR